jgi:6-phosphogluconolactonase (cycloisomerase 2 family)
VITITPDGDFLYSANNDATVGAYSIGANGALTHIADLDVGACDTGVITANNSYVWVTDTCGNSGPWNVMTMTIGANGSLTNASTVALTGVDAWLWSIQVNPVAPSTRR